MITNYYLAFHGSYNWSVNARTNNSESVIKTDHSNTVNDLIKDFPTFDAPVFMGGPVQTDNLFYLHTQGDHIDESIKISDNLYWSGNFNQLKNMIKNNEIFPDEIKFFLGYSGWDHQQLTDELKEESWLISNIQTNHLKDLNETDLWHNTLQKISEKHAVLSNFPENTSLN